MNTIVIDNSYIFIAFGVTVAAALVMFFIALRLALRDVDELEAECEELHSCNYRLQHRVLELQARCQHLQECVNDVV